MLHPTHGNTEFLLFEGRNRHGWFIEEARRAREARDRREHVRRNRVLRPQPATAGGLLDRLLDGLLERLGDGLIEVGRRLKARHGPPAAALN